MTLPIKQHRKKLGLTQKALAAKLGVSLPSVVNWENGKISPKGKNLAKVKKFLASTAEAPKKATKKAAAPKKRGRPKVSTPAKKSGVSAQLSGVAKDLGFASVDEMVKTILRKHKIGKLDL